MAGGRDWQRFAPLAILLAAVALVLFWLSSDSTTPPDDSDAGPPPGARDADEAEYVGTPRCAECHEEEAAVYRGSHHDRAIETPGPDAVLAPFDGRTFTHADFEATFSREDDAYRVRTEGPDGELATYDVAYTFGVDPLQQYLLDLGGGRLQALTVAWDARAAEDGGQRFFDLYPDERIEAGDPLHWTGSMQSWNYVCADCHSTALRKGYDAEGDTFETTWAELDVGCEACHGPGSSHVAWAEAGSEGDDAQLVLTLERAPEWVIAEGAPNVEARRDRAHLSEVETCAPCHSRRQQLAEARRPDAPYLDFYRPELLDEALYHPDGQIEGEVYVYGSFLQSKMFHAGVRCSDCHEPHSLGLRREGNALCNGCHAEAIYDTEGHHHHEGDGSACVDCHMLEQTYMQIDPRRDHSLRVPRPDLAATLGVPDPCTRCHEDQEPAWAAERIREWYGPERSAHWGLAIAAGRTGSPGAGEMLRGVSEDASLPAIVRGTALSLLSGTPTQDSMRALAAGAESDDALVRLGAIYGARGLPPEARPALLSRLLRDPRLAIRIEAARELAMVPPRALEGRDAEALERAIGELLEAERLHADRADAWLRIGRVALDRGRAEEAASALDNALERDPSFIPALVNLADLRRMQGDEAEAEALLRRAIERDDEAAEAHHALGLLLVRTERTDEARPHFERAVELRPDNPRFHYVLAVATRDAGDLSAAIAVLERALERHPNDVEMLLTMAQFASEAGDAQRAGTAAAQLRALRPDDPRIEATLAGLSL